MLHVIKYILGSGTRSWVKKWIYLFVLLILYDGVFRKWLLPGMSNELMVLKILVAFFIIISGHRYLNRLTFWDWGLVILGTIGFLTTLIFGHGNITVALWGCLPFWLIPVCPIISKALNRKDIFIIMEIFVYTAIVNFFFTVFEFSQPLDSFINQESLENEELNDLSAGELAGLFRPSGIFIHNSQSCSFVLLAFSFCLYLYYSKGKTINKTALYLAMISCLLTPLFTVSRTMVFYVIGMILVFFYFSLAKGRLHKVFIPILIGLMALPLFFSTQIGDSAVVNMLNRFENASLATTGENVSSGYGNLEDIFNRTVVYKLKAITDPHTLDGEVPPFFGFGQGMSTQVGGRLLGIKGHAGFALAEWDGLRIMCESGYLLGWLIIFFRLGYAFRFLGRFRRSNPNKLSIFLYPSFLVSFFVMNTWGNAFFFCFALLCGGLYLASINRKNEFGKKSVKEVQVQLNNQ